ncbi:butyrophilin subfamily 1 member A1-like, partial [Clarias magur]
MLFGADVPLVTEAGEDLFLSCFIKPSTNAVNMTVQWSKLDAVNSLVHLCDIHEDRNENQKSYRRRTSLFKDELQKGNASLKLSALSVSDEGKYKCFIENKSWFDYVIVQVIIE